MSTARESLKRYAWPIAAVAFVLLAFAAAQAIGAVSRTSLPAQQRIEVSSAQEAYDAFERLGQKNRVVIVFDESSGVVERLYEPDFGAALISDEKPPVVDENLASALMYEGLAREIRFAPPDSVWAELPRRISTRLDAVRDGEVYTIRYRGVPVRLGPASSLKPSAEKVVVYVGDPSGYPASVIEQWTSPDRADLVIVRKPE